MQHSSQPSGGLSVEEILESIKKVIARDNHEVAQVERHRRETVGVIFGDAPTGPGLEPLVEDGQFAEEAEEYEVLDLGDTAAQMLEEPDPAPTPEAQEIAPKAEDDDEAEDDDPAEGDVAAEAMAPIADPEVSQEIPAPDSPTPDSPAADSPPSDSEARVRNSLAVLAALSDPVASAHTDEAEAPLDRILRETLRPMLAEWLDANLPQIAEQLVKTEIERILGKPR